MAEFDANIRININDTAALAALKKLEDKIAQLSDPRTAASLKNLVNIQRARQEFIALKQERAEDLAYRRKKTRQIAYELRLNNALELQEGRRIKLQRAGALDVASRKKAVAKLDKIAAANPKNAEIQERVATGLGRILTTQNEINRATNKNIGQKQRIADYNKQIDRLRELGATEGQLRKAQKRKYEFIDAAERRQTSLSDRRELQLKREIKLVRDAQKAARDAATAVTRPGTLSGGARSALSSGPARSILGSPAADKARFEFYQKEYNKALAEVFKTEQAYEKQLQTNKLNNIKAEEAAELASINRVAAAEKAQNKRINDEVRQNDRLQRATEAGITASARAGGPRSTLSSGPARSVLGSPAADKARFEFYQKEYDKALAKVFKTEQAYEKQLQTNSLNNIKAKEAAELASINRVAAAEKAQNKRINDEVKQNDRLQRAREAGITASARAGGPSSQLPERSVLGSDEALRRKAKYYEDIAKSIKPLSSQLPERSVLGSDEALRRKAKYYEDIAKSIKGPSSSLSDAPARTVLGSNAELKQKAAYYERIARSAKNTAKSTKETNKNTEKANKAARASKKGQGLLGFGQTATNLSAGAGFPLLFGGGPGSVLGGLAGGLLGGFGGSIIFGALGQQLDALGAAALSTADAFGKLGATASDLITKLGSGAGNGFGDRAQFLIDEGSQSQVGKILRDRFAEVYGDQALRDFEALAETNKEFKQTWTELGVQFQLLIDGPLKGLLDIVNRINFKAKKDDELTPQELKVRKLEQRNRSFGPTITQANIDELNEAKATLTETKTTQKDTNKTNAEKALLDLVKQKAAIEEKVNKNKLAAVSQALTARRDELAVLNTAASITRASAELDNTRKELTAERLNTIKDIYRITQLEKTEAEQAAELERQQIAQANARALAERQILQERRALSIEEFDIRQQITNEKVKFAALSATEEKQYALKISLIKDEYQTAVDTLTVQKAAALEGKNELEIINQITEKFKKQEELALKRAQTQSKEVFQAEVLRQDRLQAIADQKELNKLTAENAAIKAIDSNNPERTASFSGAGLGFFAESAIIEANVTRDSAAQLEAYNEQIGNLQKRIKNLSESNFGGINDGRLSIKQEQLDRLTQTRDLYAQLQPQIDAARIKQAQFNDALAAVTPGVNALVGGLQEVVAGTKSAEEAFADFLNTIADQLIQTAATLIAQYIAIGLAKAFAGLSGSGGGGLNFDTSAPSITGNTLGDFGGGTPFAGAFRAEGGPVSANRPYIVGERGPELLIPQTSGTVLSNEDSRAALAKYSPGNNLLSEAGDSTGTVAGRNETLNPVINISTGPTLQFEGEGYVKQEDFKAGLARAAQEGAKQGQTLTLRKLMMSPTARSKIGI